MLNLIFIRRFIDINNYLLSPETRLLEIVLGKNEKFLAIIQQNLKEFEEAKIPISNKSGEFEFMGYNIICKRNEWNKTIEGFCIVFAEELKLFQLNFCF